MVSSYLSEKYNPMNQEHTTESEKATQALAPLRKQIDQFDQQIVELLNARAQVVVEVGKIKATEKSPVYAPERERRVLNQIRKYNNGPLPDRTIESIWRELMSGSFALERPLRIGYLGPKGSYSHLAAKRKFGASVEYDALPDIPAVFEEVTRRHIDIGMVPMENSTEGGIHETLDSFLIHPVAICAEVSINVHHNLLSNTNLNEIKKVYSKPNGFSQCRKWLGMQLGHAELVPVASTSRAAELASQEPGTAAIGSSLAGEIYNIQQLYTNIEDNPNNTTRFLVISNEKSKPSGDDKTAIMFTTAHKSGALAEVLDIIRNHGLNLTHIDNRPSQRANWEYCFFIDFPGHENDENVIKAIEEARQHCLQLSVLGSFPRAIDVL